MTVSGLKNHTGLLCFLESYIAPWRLAVKIDEHIAGWSKRFEPPERTCKLPTKKDRPQVSFVGVRVSRDVKAKFDKWVTREAFDWLDELEHQLQAGIKVGVTWDRKNDCFIVSATNWIEGDENYGWCFSTRNSSVQKALQLALYKLLVVLEGCVWEEHDVKDDFG